jgi:hypothetical protein
MAAGARPKYRAALRPAALTAAFALFVALFDPLGIDAAGDRRSADAVDRVAALYYPADHGRRAITTVPIDEAALAAAGREWPPQYDFYAEVLDAAVKDPAARPAAVFLDFTFVSELYSEAKRDIFVARVHEVTKAVEWADRPECHETPLAKLGCIHKAGGIPVIIGKPYPVDRCDLSLTVLLLDRAAILTPLGWPGMGGAWRPAISKERYRQQRTADEACPAVDGIAGSDGPITLDYSSETLKETLGTPLVKLTPRGVTRYDLTPSSAMFAALCLRNPGISPHCVGEEDRPTLEQLVRSDRPFHVFWPSIPDPDYLRFEEELYPSAVDRERRARCARESDAPLHALSVGLKEFFAGLNTDDAPTKVECAYHADIRYEAFSDPAFDPHRPAFVKDRAIIVGVALVQSNDWTPSLTRGRTPGMGLHAMALDNLLERGPDMQRSPPEFLFPLDWGEVVELALAFGLAFVIAWADLRAPAIPAGQPGALAARRRRLGLAALAIGGSLIIFLAAAFCLTAVFHWTPVNVVGLWTLSVVVAVVRFHDSLLEAARAFRDAVTPRAKPAAPPRQKPKPRPKPKPKPKPPKAAAPRPPAPEEPS